MPMPGPMVYIGQRDMGYILLHVIYLYSIVPMLP